MAPLSAVLAEAVVLARFWHRAMRRHVDKLHLQEGSNITGSKIKHEEHSNLRYSDSDIMVRRVYMYMCGKSQ